ncbi:MAG TPA: outer membrane beta-barrel protein [Steroidobacter sp.]|uniref:outer membrane beta-barrel protein n=1 Tax=Steroidobacter sp. TaxID=1978227 RepID=UPI002ED91E62
MIKRGMIAAGVGMMLSAAPSMAANESTGWYFGATGGQAQADLDRAEYDAGIEGVFAQIGAPLTSGSSDLEDTDVSWSLFGGYRLSPFFSLEAGYIDLGASEYRASGTVNPPGPSPSTTASYSADVEVSGFTAAAIGMLPLGEMFQLHGQAGVLFTNLEISQAISLTGFGADSDRRSSDSRDFFFGVGGGLNIGEQWTLNLDWQRFKDVGDEDETGETDIDRISLGVIYRL